MKDMMGIKLEVGQHIFYFTPGPGGMVHEEAEIILIRKKSIKVKFLGNVSRRRKGNGQLSWGRKKGEQTNLYNTTGKVFVLCKHVEKERVVLNDRIRWLAVENEKLREEVNRIHNRFEILDL